jgi:hypothetical protein
VTTPPPEEQRAHLLREAHHWAAIADEVPTIAHETALEAARRLMHHDQVHGTHTPDQPGPASATWHSDTGPLDYVHTQWQHRTP